MRKTFFHGLLCLFLAVLLAGCGARGPSAQEAATAAIPEPLSAARLASKGYGEIAYAYLEYWDQHYPRRAAGTQREKDAAGFIVSALLDMGYAADDIAIQEFSGSGGEIPSQNILLTIEGNREETILVGAHYDSVETNGASDNASGVSLVLETALRLRGNGGTRQLHARKRQP